MSLKELVAIAVSVTVALVYAGREIAERRKTKALGLAPNPERCDRHEERIGKLEGTDQRFDERFKNIECDIAEIKSDVKTLLSRKP